MGKIGASTEYVVSPKYRNILWSKIMAITESLYNCAKIDDRGLSWITSKMSNNGAIKWDQNGGIYSGSVGILLFLISLYETTKNKDYIELLEEAGNWVYAHYRKSNDTSFFYGITGASLVLMKLARAISNRDLSTKALDLIKNLPHPSSKGKDFHFINGIAGEVLGLLHLHSSANENWILSRINHLVGMLLDGIKLSPFGLIWPTINERNFRFCGFSDGNSGVAYVFLELANYLNNDAFYWIASQAFKTESRFYRKKDSCWVNYGVYRDKMIHSTMPTSGFANQKTYETIDDSWHNALSMKLARLHAIELFKKIGVSDYLSVEDHLSIKISSDLIPDFGANRSLGYGLGGYIYFLHEMYRITGNESHGKTLNNLLNKALAKSCSNETHYPCRGTFVEHKNPGLFSGEVGMGYIYLLLLNETQVFSILKPDLGASQHISQDSITAFKNLTPSLEDIKSRIINNNLPHTYKQFKSNSYSSRSKTDTCHPDIVFDFLFETKNKENKLGSSAYSPRCQIDKSYNPFILQFSRTNTIKKNRSLIKDVSDDELYRYQFKIVDEVKLLKGDNDVILILYNSKELKEFQMTNLSAYMINQFEIPTSCRNIYLKIQKMGLYEQTTKEIRIATLLVDQVKHLLKFGLITLVNRSFQLQSDDLF